MTEISVITINKNNAIGLRKTMESVISQTFNDFEYIVIDGNSTDNSVGIIEQYADRTAYWVSEPDTGIYNAMNKGIQKSHGKYLLFLNSGDYLVDNNVLADCALQINNDVEVCSGNLWLEKEDGKPLLLKPLKELTLYTCIQSGLLHPCTFIKRTLFERYGLYNENNRIISDWELFLVACGMHDVTYLPIERDIAYFGAAGISSQNKQLLQNETKQVLERLLPLAIRKDMERLHYLESLNSERAFCALRIIKNKSLIYRIISRFLQIISKIFH